MIVPTRLYRMRTVLRRASPTFPNNLNAARKYFKRLRCAPLRRSVQKHGSQQFVAINTEVLKLETFLPRERPFAATPVAAGSPQLNPGYIGVRVGVPGLELRGHELPGRVPAPEITY